MVGGFDLQGDGLAALRRAVLDRAAGIADNAARIEARRIDFGRSARRGDASLVGASRHDGPGLGFGCNAAYRDFIADNAAAQRNEPAVRTVLDTSGRSDQTDQTAYAARSIHRGGGIERHGGHVAAITQRAVADPDKRRGIFARSDASCGHSRRSVDRQLADLRTLGRMAEERF